MRQLIAVPSAMTNRTGQRDESMHQTKKGNQWSFGATAQIGMDDALGLVHQVHFTAANVADVTHVYRLLDGKEDTVWRQWLHRGGHKCDDIQQIAHGFLCAARPPRWVRSRQPANVD